MGLYPGRLVCALFHFSLVNPLVAFENPLVVFVAYALSFLSRQKLSKLVTLFHWLYLYQKESSPKVVDS